MKTKLVLVGRMGWKNNAAVQKLHSFKKGEVVYLGFVDDEDLPYLYRLAKGFIYTSLYEGFGLTPLEAISQGLPVITSDIPSVKEVLGDSAFYFKSNDKNSLEKIWDYYENQCSSLEKKEIIRKGIERSKQFRHNKCAKIVLNYFNNSKHDN